MATMLKGNFEFGFRRTCWKFSRNITEQVRTLIHQRSKNCLEELTPKIMGRYLRTQKREKKLRTLSGFDDHDTIEEARYRCWLGPWGYR